MKHLLKPIAYTLGGTVLMSGSFFMFASLSGTPLSQVAMIGDYFPDEEEGAVTASQDAGEISEQLAGDRRNRAQVLEAAASPLRAFVLESPFSAGELEALEQRLQLRLQELDRRERGLEARERELDESLQHVQGLYAELEGLRNQLLAEKDEIEAHKDEIERDANAVTERQKAAFRGVAPLFEEGTPAVYAQMLIDGYSATEAAQILAALDDARVRELLQAVHKIDPATFDAFEEAYRGAK
jgi:DNA repair exonuclease SbcCD ATPase subunit